MNLPSKHLEETVEHFASLPGIGKRTALRLALHLLKQPADEAKGFSDALALLHKEVGFCEKCHNISDDTLCRVCANPKRDRQTICVVQDMRDVIAIEHTQQFNGVYHVLGGIISPVDGIGPDDLNIDSLIRRVDEDQAKELIMALSTTMEGDTTNFYVYRRLENHSVDITTIARGVAIGDELEYTDEVTLGRSIANRTPYQANGAS